MTNGAERKDLARQVLKQLQPLGSTFDPVVVALANRAKEASMLRRATEALAKTRARDEQSDYFDIWVESMRKLVAKMNSRDVQAAKAQAVPITTSAVILMDQSVQILGSLTD